MQAKRIQVNEGNGGATSFVDATLEAPTSPREEINYHNIWGSVSVEPQDTDANAQGSWFLMIIKENATSPNLPDTTVNGESNNAVIIACGVWSASNQSPYNSGPIHPETSRTLQPGDKLVLKSEVTGITAGLASNRVMLCAHTTRK